MLKQTKIMGWTFLVHSHHVHRKLHNHDVPRRERQKRIIVEKQIIDGVEHEVRRTERPTPYLPPESTVVALILISPDGHAFNATGQACLNKADLKLFSYKIGFKLAARRALAELNKCESIPLYVRVEAGMYVRQTPSAQQALVRDALMEFTNSTPVEPAAVPAPVPEVNHRPHTRMHVALEQRATVQEPQAAAAT